MSAKFGNLVKAARQILQTEELLGSEYIPAMRNPLPAIEVARPAEQAFDGIAESGPQGPRSMDAGGPDRAGPSSAAPTLQVPSGEHMTRDEKIAALAEVEKQVRRCKRCGLCSGRNNVVFGEGDAAAALMFIGEAPGEEEDKQGRPFVGRAGQKLNEMIAAMGLRREDVYIANIAKCRPPNNRPPMPEEALACREHLIRQIAIIHPKAIVTLGNPSTQNMLNTTVGITRLRGQWQQLPPIAEGLGGIPVMPTFHPAFLLRQYTPENRRKVWEDLQKVMDLLGLKKK